MKNIHLIPTDKLSRLCIDNSCNELNYSDIEGYSSIHITNQNIYITSDEEIKEGDWFLALDGTDDIIKADLTYVKIVNEDKLQRARKIILASDTDLIADGVQEISEDFLQWFVNHPSCEFVKTDLVPVNEFGSEITVGGYGFDKFKYKIIIPKEEPNPLTVGKEFYESADKNITVYKQETLEEAAERTYQKGLQDDIDLSFYDGVRLGAKWQQERMYSEEEVIDSIKYTIDNFFNGKLAGLNSKEIFEQFKNK
jgi:hypothetical protein